MSSEDPVVQSRKRKALLAKLGVGMVVLAVIAALLLRGMHPGEMLHAFLEQIRAMGPFAFFAAMAVLPSLGFPVSAFTLSAGPAFGEQMGLPALIGAAALSMAVNLALSYWISRYAMRPWIERLARWAGYKLPTVKPGDHLGLVLLVRLTPGPPYALQGVVLGLAEVPFRIYLIVSWLVVMGYTTAFIVFGKALMEGKGGAVAIGVALLAIVVIIVRMVRRNVLKKREAEGA